MKKQQSTYNVIAAYYAANRDIWVSNTQRQTFSRADAEDIVQDVFLRLLRNDNVMISTTTLPGLIHFMMRNRVKDYWRRRHTYDEYEHFIKNHSQATGADVASVYNAVEMEELLERGILQLGERQQQVCRLNMYDGMGVKDIATTLQQDYKKVENMLGVARRKLRVFVARMWAS